MAVTIELPDLDYARYKFEQFLDYNKLSTEKAGDGTYYYGKTQNMWVAFQSGFRFGRASVNGSCEF